MADDSGVWVKIVPDDFGGGAPGAAVIDSAVADDPDNYPVKTSSYTGDGTNGEDGQNYDVYEFLGSGTLNVTTAGFVDVVIAAGGAGGGADHAGGGGAGGYLSTVPGENTTLGKTAEPQQFYEKGTYSIVIGGGGAGAASNAVSGSPGAQSSLGSIIVSGGGCGAGTNNSAQDCGCGGGGSNGNKAKGLGTRGFNGGQGASNGGDYRAGGGGGGAGSNGSDGEAVSPGGRGGAGGDGVTSKITGDPVTRCGGGGGGSRSLPQNGIGGPGGSGGGGAGGGKAPGSEKDNGADADANTGSGGGGGANGSSGGNGGSGIVIVRVKVASESYPFRTKTTAPRTAHAARIEDGIVREVIVIPHLDDDDAKITAYCNRIGLPGEWVDTSYLGSRRGKYAGVGDTFTMTKSGGEFISPIIEEVEE